MKKVIILSVVLVLTLVVSLTFAKTYYVSELFGDNSNDGLSDAAPFATIQKAADIMVAGDKVIVDFGEYRETVVPKNNGSAGNPVVFEAKDDVTVFSGDPIMIPVFTLHGGNIYVMDNVFRSVFSLSESGTPLTKKDALSILDTEPGWFQDRAANKLYIRSTDDANPSTHQDTVTFKELSFDIVEGSYITIKGFKIKNGISAIVADNLNSLAGLVIQSNVFQGDADDDTQDSGISINGGEADSLHTYDNFLIAKNTFMDCWRGINIKNAGRNSVISENTFTDVGVPGKNDPAIRLEGSSDFPGVQCQGLVIERNLFDQIYGRAIYLRNGDIDDITIQNNISHRIGSIFAIFYNSRHIDIINNTIVFCGSEFAVRYKPECSGNIFNNIFVADYMKPRSVYLEDIKLPDPSAWDYNYWVTDTSVASASYRDDQLVRWKDPNGVVSQVSKGPGGSNAVYGHVMKAEKDTTFDANGDTLFLDSIPDMGQPALPLFVDPKPLFSDTLISDMHLVDGSLAIDAARADVAPQDDYFGNPRDAKPDIGAIEFGATGIDILNNLFPKEYRLYDNYPNPFNPETTIEYTLAKSGNVSLIVYNLMGQKVFTLQEGFQRIGKYSVKWNGLDNSGKPVTSGIYVYQLEAGGIIKSAKMILLK
jgi:hypothetical protein